MTGPRVLTTAALLLAATVATGADEAKPEFVSPYAQWKNGPPKDDSFFPIGVCTQEPNLAPMYQKAGINFYEGLWKGPTEAQLAELKKWGMRVSCSQNAVGLAHKDDPLIIAWEIEEDEPDNAQALPSGTDYGPPIPPAKVVEEYDAIRKADPTRPVFLCLGQGVAWDGWVGRGVRTNHPEDYAEYAKACDIVAYDIYPVAHSKPEVKGKLDFVARGVERLVQWTHGRKPVWDAIECTRINSDTKATPKQVKAEVWMSLVHGAAGILYFVHEWKPKFDEHALLDDPQMLAAVTAINKQVRELAPALNSPTVKDALKVDSSNKGVPVAAMVKKHGGATYVFAVAMKPGATDAGFTLEGLPAGAQVEVIGENRKIEPAGGEFKDRFGDWDVHLYRIK
ncbi:MAG: beta-galactosidase [Candidatus Brocadiia bacterium]